MRVRNNNTMKVAFISCYMSPHQKPFCDEMYNILGDDFNFIATQPIEDERISMGWSSDKAPYILYAYKNKESKLNAEKVSLGADVVILGSAPDSYIVPRLKAGKLTFKYSERFYKTGLDLKKIPHAIVGAWLHHGRFQRYPLYMLCASAYTAGDAAIFHNYIDKTYKWGYFPEAKRYDLADLMSKKLSVASDGLKHPVVSILWAGRLIGLKHPDVSIQLAASLKDKGYAFKMSIIGSGEMEQQLHAMIEEKKLSDCVEMLGAMPPEKVREHMEKADIYLFTSDFNEGWGAVLNESMNSGCAVVASHAIGSVPFLIKNGENGLIYENGNQQQLEEKVEFLLRDEELRKKLAVNAYQSIVNVWSADIAAKRFVALSSSLLKGEPVDTLFAEGPCSKAVILKNNWISDSET